LLTSKPKGGLDPTKGELHHRTKPTPDRRRLKPGQRSEFSPRPANPGRQMRTAKQKKTSNLFGIKSKNYEKDPPSLLNLGKKDGRGADFQKKQRDYA